jgi:hypothetical protein
MTDGSVKSTCYWSGIYPNLDISDNMKCAKLLEKLLCYDTCLITVDDFLFLVKTFGIDAMNLLIKDGAFEIYNNLGIKVAIANISENDPLILNFSVDKAFDPEVHASEYQRIYNVKYDDKTLDGINKILIATSCINIDDKWIHNLNKEIENDLNNATITSKLGLINDGKIINRDHDYNQIMYNRIAYLNLYMALGNKLKLSDIMLPVEIQNLLDVKLGAYIKTQNSIINDSFTSIVEYAGVYDIFNLFESNVINFADIIRIRNNKKSIDFRRWLEQTVRSATLPDIVELYNAAIKEGVVLRGPKESTILKTLKFAVPKAIGFIPIVGGPISNIIDTSLFAKDIFSNNYKPSIFIEECLKKEIADRMNEHRICSENDYYVKIHGKIPVNSRCPCGSSKKYKKCHGRYVY